MSFAHRLLFMLTAVAVALCVASVLYPVDWSQPIWQIFGVLVFALALMVPFIIIFALKRFIKTTEMVYGLCALNVVLMLAWLYFFSRTFIWGGIRDSHANIVFAVAPIYGIVLAVGVGGLIFMADIALRGLREKDEK